eukprot:CFRG4668T1
MMEESSAIVIQCAWRRHVAQQYCRSIQRRIHIVNEIVENERVYVSNLAYISILYEEPLLNLSQEGKPLIPECTIKSIFKDIKLILKIHTSLLRVLSARHKVWAYNSTIGDCFVDVWEDLSMLYATYVLGTQATMTIINNTIDKNAAFKSFLKTQRNSDPDASSLTLEDLLMSPVQRIPRYELLLGTMSKHTVKTHPDSPYLEKALVAVRELATSIDNQKRRVEATRREHYLLAELRSFGVHLANDRHLIKEYNVVELVRNVKGKTRRSRKLFVFNDLLVCAKSARQDKDILDDTKFTPKWMTFLQNCSSMVGYSWDNGENFWDTIDSTLRNYIAARDSIFEHLSDAPSDSSSGESPNVSRKWGSSLRRKKSIGGSALKRNKDGSRLSQYGESLSSDDLSSSPRLWSGTLKKPTSKDAQKLKSKATTSNLFGKPKVVKKASTVEDATKSYIFTGNECTRWLSSEFNLTNEECIILCQELCDKDHIAIVGSRSADGRFAVDSTRDLKYRMVPKSARPKIDIVDNPIIKVAQEVSTVGKQIAIERQIAKAAERISDAQIKKTGERNAAKKQRENTRARVKNLEEILQSLRNMLSVCSYSHGLHIVSYACHSKDAISTSTGRMFDGDVDSDSTGHNSGLSVRTVFFSNKMDRDEVVEQLLPASCRQAIGTESLSFSVDTADELHAELSMTPEYVSAVSRLSWLELDDSMKRGVYSFAKKGSKRYVHRDYVISCQRPTTNSTLSSSLSSFDGQWGPSWSSLIDPAIVSMGKPSPVFSRRASITKHGSISSATSALLYSTKDHKQEKREKKVDYEM